MSRPDDRLRTSFMGSCMYGKAMYIHVCVKLANLCSDKVA